MTTEQIVQRAVARTSHYAVFAFDGDGTALSWNEGVLHVLGYAREDFVGSDADRTFTPEDRARGAPEEERRQALERGAVGDFRWHLKRDGTRFWANGSVHAVRDDDGSVAAFVKIMRDATRDKELQDALERSHAELEERVEERTRELLDANEQLRRSEARFADVFRAAPIAMAVATSGDEILDVNAAFERLTGYARDDVLGRDARHMGLWTREERRAAREDGTAPRTLELQIRTRDGRVRDVLASTAAVDLDHAGGWVRMFLDITERKRTERHLTQALQEVMQDTSWLARSVMEKLAQARGESREGPEVGELTPRERDVLTCIAQGKTNERIAQELELAPSTVRNYVTSIYAKLGVGSRAEAVVWARERGLGGP